MKHATRSDTTPDPQAGGFTSGGYWAALCLTCGWEEEGRYAAGHEADGLKLANLKGDLHETGERLKEVRNRG